MSDITPIKMTISRIYNFLINSRRLKEESDVKNVMEYFQDNQDFDNILKKEQVHIPSIGLSVRPTYIPLST